MEHLHLLSNSTSPPIPTLPYCKPQSDFLLLVSRQSHSCIPTYPALFSTILGFLSIASWLFAQLPQIVKNYRLKSTASLSFLFLLNWCFGDSLNFAGAVLLDQMTFQKVVAAYYVFVDVVLVGQWIWYRENDEAAAAAAAASQASSGRTITVRRGSGSSIMKRHSTKKGSLLAKLTMLFTTSHAIPIASVIVTGPVARMITSSISPSSSSAVSIMGSGSDLDDEYITRLGRFVAWLSTALYVSSRAPQLYLNYTRKSVSGLSPLLFLAAFCGNFFYTSSLLMNPCARKDIDPFGEFGWVGENGSVMGEWWKDTLPFMLGAAGVLGMDASVGIQFWLWGGNDDDNNAEVIVGVNIDGDDDDDEYDYDGGDEGYTVEVSGKKSNGGGDNRAWKRFVGVDIKNEKAAEWNDNSRSATPTNYSETAALLVPRLGYGSFGRTNGSTGVGGGGFGGGDIDADTVYGSTSSAGAMLEAEFGSVKGKGRGI